MKTIKNLKAEEIRKSILQLAIQGKLVKQDPNDEPASELVKRIYAEKQRLIKDGKIKKDKNESFIFKGDDNCYYEKIGINEPVKLEDLPFDIPDNWIWIRLKSIANITAGGTPDRGTPKYWNGNIPWLKISDITSSNKYVRKASECITEDGMNNSSAKIMRKGTILYTIFATIGEVGILDFDAACNQAIAGLDTYDKSVNDYLYFLLVNLQDYMKSISKGCAQFNINQKILKDAIIALPPLEEQLRIVNKINSFEPLLVQYEAAENKLTILEEEFPSKLKKSILQYAIEGKLVKQDPNDEPASVLLERIKAEKEQLIKEGKIKRDKNESYIYQGDDKNYYENLPQGWAVTTLATIISLTSGADLTSQEYSSDNIGVPYLTGASNISRKNEIIINRYTKEKYINSHLDEILLSCKGTIGKIVKNNIGECHVARQFMSIKSFINKEYLIIYLRTLVDTLISEAKSMIPGIDRNQILTKLIAVPPSNEQKRIGCKLETLLKYIQ